nr:MAG TPA: hypothetical protein [Bacteriophage sp.]
MLIITEVLDSLLSFVIRIFVLYIGKYVRYGIILSLSICLVVIG